jgi:hypothetical protein
MTLAYLPRLACLCFAAFFVVCAASELAALALLPPAMRIAAAMRPREGARFLFAWRSFPAALAGLVVFMLCIPSYLWLEPGVRHERVGIACVIAAILGGTVCFASAMRGIHSVAATFRFGRRCHRAGTITRLTQDGASPACLLAGHDALLGITGVFRPWLVVSQGVLNTLSKDQLSVALRHEAAHMASRDNLRRLLLLVAPRALPWHRSRKMLESGWTRFAEWAADDWAVDGDPRSSLSLATALVRMARMGEGPRMAPLSMSLLNADYDLSARVRRLLQDDADPAHRKAKSGKQDRRGARTLSLPGSAALPMAGFLAAMIMRPATLHSVHWLLERLTH